MAHDLETLWSTRYRQIAAVADLGLFALERSDVHVVLQRAVETAASVLSADLAEVLALRADGGGLDIPASVGWPTGSPGRAVIGIGGVSQAAYTIDLREPVVSEDLATERRFDPDPLLLAYGVVAAVTVPVLGPGEVPWGALGVHWRHARGCTAHEIAFLQAVANVVGTALARADAERRADEALASTARAHEALRLRDEFLSIASHELKTPLTSLQLQLESLIDQPSDLDARVRNRLVRATRSAERLAALVETLLDVSRLATGRMNLRIEDVSLDDVVLDVVERLRTEAERAGCTITTDLRPVRGRWDRLRVEQILINLLSNAFRYGAGKPVEVTIALADGEAELRVVDHGRGIEPKDTGRIFERFERAVPSQHYGGLGLGLYVSRQIAEAHGGVIVVDSRPGEGATFVVRLPREPAHAAPPRPTQSRPKELQ